MKPLCVLLLAMGMVASTRTTTITIKLRGNELVDSNWSLHCLDFDGATKTISPNYDDPACFPIGLRAKAESQPGGNR